MFDRIRTILEAQGWHLNEHGRVCKRGGLGYTTFRDALLMAMEHAFIEAWKLKQKESV